MPPLPLLMTLAVSIASPLEGDIVVTIENLRNPGQGELILALYKPVERVELEVKTAFKILTAPVSGPTITLTFKKIPYGEYAVGVFHDIDKNKKLKTNWLGIPREDLAVSNNAKGGPFGAPKWGDAKFTLTAPQFKLPPLRMAAMYDN